MSSFVKSIPGHRLSYEALEMACHFVDAYISRLEGVLFLSSLYILRIIIFSLNLAKCISECLYLGLKISIRNIV